MRELLVENVAALRKGAIKIGPFGSALPLSKMVQDGIKVYGQENLISRDWHLGAHYIRHETFEVLRTCELHPGDVVMAMMGSLGHCEVFSADAERGIMDSHLLRIQVNESVITPEYLRYSLLSRATAQQIHRLSHGSIMAGLSSKIIRKIRIYVPDLEEQKWIVEVLGAIDQAIEASELIIEKSLRTEWGLKRDLIYNRSGSNGSWKQITVGDLGTVVTGGTPPTSEDRFWHGHVPFITPGDITTRGEIRRTTRSLTNLGANYTTTVPAGSVAVVCIGSTIGKIGRIKQTSTTNQQINTIVPSSKFNDEFIASTMELLHPRLEAMAGRQAIPIINAKLLRMMPLHVCSLSAQERIANNILSIRHRISVEHSLLEKLRLLRFGVAADLLSGRVRTAEA